ncbi:hypothetical protein IV203_002773 [Nitzschia inconspicua]|uniref:Uncharacterized protein n=1 Tax=Nitzschia inconspicua TaxID=303405 RepID=A0A9K3L220_9STRA|nr:hypothetical protein IV203_002773 [Nitzschia inconspicua]
MARITTLSLPRFRLRLVIFCITVILSVGVAFPGSCLKSSDGSRNKEYRSRSCASGWYLSSTGTEDKLRRVPSQPESLTVRGGDEPISGEKEVIRKYLESMGSTATSLDKFHIHGWRWHTRSLIRETGRLHTLASKTSLPNAILLQEATDYVVNFNLRGLHKVEADLFFPWMRKQLTSLPQSSEVSRAFSSVMTELENGRLTVSQLGKTIQRNADLAVDTRKPDQDRVAAIQTIADQSMELQECARSMMQLEDNYLVPAIAGLVPERDQRSFNNKVLRGLGLLDSRLHLVSMYEAVTQDENRLKEEELFQKAIPSVPQMMIPRWKRKLYVPKTYMFE